jgi:WD40 repeat protein
VDEVHVIARHMIVRAFALAVVLHGGTVRANEHFTQTRTIPLPGRGLILSWAPDGHAIAVGGHLIDKERRGLRYDTKIYDATTGAYVKAFGSHYWWVLALDWASNPYLGEVIADAGDDHSCKVWFAGGKGTTRTLRGQYRIEDGAVPGIREISSAGLVGINGTMLSLHFSPDGRYLAAANRDRTVRIWQMEPGPHQFEIIRIFYDYEGGNITSVRWSPDGTHLAVGDRRGRVSVRSFDPARDRWDDETIAAFRKLWWSRIPYWLKTRLPAVTKEPVWMDRGHKVVWNVRYSPDGHFLAAGGTDGTLNVYDAVTGRVVYRKRTAPLYGLDWSRDGRYLAAGSEDHHIHVYEAASGSLYDTLVGHEDLVTTVAWSPDGRTLASTAGGPLHSPVLTATVAGPDMSIRLWSPR